MYVELKQKPRLLLNVFRTKIKAFHKNEILSNISSNLGNG